MVWIILGGLAVAWWIFARQARASRVVPAVAHERVTAVEAAARAVRMERPTLLFVRGNGAGRSRLGGQPDLPVGVEWPVGPRGPMGFLAQVDLAEVKRCGGPEWLPDQGLLSVFHDDDYGMAGQARVLHLLPETSPATPPVALKKAWRYPERPVKFELFRSVPSLDWLDLSLTDEDAFDDLGIRPFPRGPEHRLGGYPTEIQNEQMAVSCEYYGRGMSPYDQKTPPSAELIAAAASWRLLFQIDSDEDLDTNWGDGGMLYVFVREEDARAGDFSKTVTLSQTYRCARLRSRFSREASDKLIGDRQTMHWTDSYPRP